MDSMARDWLDASAGSDPDRLAVADRDERLTYAALRERARSLANHLNDAGTGSGDHVAIDLPAGVAHAVALHGAILAGAIVQSLPPNRRDAAQLAPGATIVDAATLAGVANAPASFNVPRRDLAEPLTRTLTSGTSGDPKPVELTAGNHLASALASSMNLGVEPGDRWLCCLPLHHIGGLSILIRAAIHGTGAVIEAGFEVRRVAALLERDEVTIASLVPTQLARLLEAGAPLERLRLLLVGGGPLPLDVLEESLDRGATVLQTYGLTEACSQVCTLAPGEARARAGSAGRPLSGTEIAIEDGEILVRGPTVAPASIAADGWLHTGDQGRIDPDGFLWVEGRRDDMILTGGENVRPERVEAALREHPDVAEAAVAGLEDREWGQIVVAYVVGTGGRELDPAALGEHARSLLERHEVPKRIVAVPELPRTASGKLQRRLLD